MNLGQEILHSGTTVFDNDVYLVKDLYLEGLTLSLTELKPYKETRGHKHDDVDEIYFVKNGFGKIQLGADDVKEMIGVNKGSIILVRKGVFHRVYNESAVMLEFICVFAKKRSEVDYEYGKTTISHRI